MFNLIRQVRRELASLGRSHKTTRSRLEAVENFQSEAESGVGAPYDFAVAVSDETTDIAAGAAKLIFHVSRDFSLTSLMAGLSDPSSAGVVTVNIKKNGATIFGANKLQIDALEDTNLTANTGYALLVTPTPFSTGDEIQIDIDDDGTDARGLKIYFVGVTS